MFGAQIKDLDQLITQQISLTITINPSNVNAWNEHGLKLVQFSPFSFIDQDQTNMSSSIKCNDICQPTASATSSCQYSGDQEDFKTADIDQDDATSIHDIIPTVKDSSKITIVNINKSNSVFSLKRMLNVGGVTLFSFNNDSKSIGYKYDGQFVALKEFINDLNPHEKRNYYLAITKVDVNENLRVGIYHKSTLNFKETFRIKLNHLGSKRCRKY